MSDLKGGQGEVSGTAAGTVTNPEPDNTEATDSKTEE